MNTNVLLISLVLLCMRNKECFINQGDRVIVETSHHEMYSLQLDLKAILHLSLCRLTLASKEKNLIVHILVHPTAY